MAAGVLLELSGVVDDCVDARVREDIVLALLDWRVGVTNINRRMVLRGIWLI